MNERCEKLSESLTLYTLILPPDAMRCQRFYGLISSTMMQCSGSVVAVMPWYSGKSFMPLVAFLPYHLQSAQCHCCFPVISGNDAAVLSNSYRTTTRMTFEDQLRSTTILHRSTYALVLQHSHNPTSTLSQSHSKN